VIYVTRSIVETERAMTPMLFVLLSLGSVLLGLITGALARRQGRRFWTWTAYGSLLAPVGLVHVLLLEREPA
jgi:hypothetical protein